MPLLPCCPYDPWPEKLAAEVGIRSDTDKLCATVHFTLRWDGTKYTRDRFTLPTSGIGVTASAEPICLSPGEDLTLIHRLELDGGGGCDAVRAYSREVTCEDFGTLAGWVDMPKECCHFSEESSIVEFSVWDGGDVPDEITIIEVPPPPCPIDVPPECCGQDGGGLSPPCFSEAPVRYSSGSLNVEAADIQTGGFGTPWGHKRRFLNRLSHSEILQDGGQSFISH